MTSTYEIFFSSRSKRRTERSVNYYNECGSGLGYIFQEEVQNTIKRIIQFPEAWTVLSKNTRRCLTRRFPYGIIYQVLEDKCILIVAVMHLNREPGYWEDRID